MSRQVIANALLKKRKKKGGFTLIELIVVIAILGVLAAVLIPAVTGYIGNANKSAIKSDAHSVYTAAAAVIASYPDRTYTGFGTGTAVADGGSGDMVVADLQQYLGASTWKFTVETLSFDASNRLTGAGILESGKHVYFDGSRYWTGDDAATAAGATHTAY